MVTDSQVNFGWSGRKGWGQSIYVLSQYVTLTHLFNSICALPRCRVSRIVHRIVTRLKVVPEQVSPRVAHHLQKRNHVRLHNISEFTLILTAVPYSRDFIQLYVSTVFAHRASTIGPDRSR